MSKQRTRRHFTAEQKAAILKRHLVDKVSVSDLCDECQLQPSVFYEWQRSRWRMRQWHWRQGEASRRAGRGKLEEKIEHLEVMGLLRQREILDAALEHALLPGRQQQAGHHAQ